MCWSVTHQMLLLQVLWLDAAANFCCIGDLAMYKSEEADSAGPRLVFAEFARRLFGLR